MSFFDFNGSMSKTVTVQEIMTHESKFERTRTGADRAHLFQVLDESMFDQTPVYDSNNKIRWFVLRDELRKGIGSTIETYLRPLESDHMISAGTAVVSSFRHLSRQRFLYVLDGNEIAGLVTYADLDRGPVRTLLFALLNELESRLIEIMQDENSDSEYWLSKIGDERTKVERWYNRRVKKDKALDVLECFSLGQLFAAGMAAGTLARRGLQLSPPEVTKMVDMRNKVAHPGLDLIATFEDLDQLIGTKELIVSTIRRIS